MYKTIIALLGSLFFCTVLCGQDSIVDIPDDIRKETVVYCIKDRDTLRMDIYRSENLPAAKQPVMMFQFGGSFMTGRRDRKSFGEYFWTLVRDGFTVVSIDYRLGMKGKKYNLRTLTGKEDGLSSAVQMAVEDLFSATDYLIEHADAFFVDVDSILVSGSSAGAVSALQADWVLKNRMAGAEILPAGFSYKGVVAFAGGIFSRVGGPKWEYGEPAPTLMFHGRKDRIVPYPTIRFFNIGMFTSKNLSRRMRRAEGDFLFVDLKGKDHIFGAGAMMSEGLFFTEWFLEEYVRRGEGRPLRVKVGKEF